MSAFEVSSLAISIGALVALGGSLYFIHRQNQTLIEQAVAMGKQNEHVANTLLRSTITEAQARFFDVSKAFLSYPHLREHFYEDEAQEGGPTALESDDVSRAYAIAEMILDVFDDLIQASRVTPTASASADWESYMADSFRASRLLRRYAIRHEAWYPDEVVRLARAAEGSA